MDKKRSIKTFAILVLGDFERYFCAFLLLSMVFCLAIQVYFRYVLNASLTWSEELSRFTFIWLAYMGAVLGAKERIHFRVTVPQLLLPVRYRRYMTMLADFIWVIFNLFFAYVGINQIIHLINFPYISPSLHWSMAYLYTCVPIGFIFMTFRIVEGYWKDYKKEGFKGLGTYLKIGETPVE